MTIHAFLLVTWPSIDHVTVSQHGATFVRDVEKIAMTFLALIVFERGIGFLPLFLVIIFCLDEMDKYVFGSVKGLGIEEVEGVVWGGQMTIHAVGHKTLFIVHMTGSLPGVVGELDLVAGSTKLGRCGSDHGVVGEAEEWKSDDYPQTDKDGGLQKLFHGCVPAEKY
jgi:hypothetical protein